MDLRPTGPRHRDEGSRKEVFTKSDHGARYWPLQIASRETIKLGAYLRTIKYMVRSTTVPQRPLDPVRSALPGRIRFPLIQPQTTVPKEEGSSRIVSLDALKALAMVAVVFLHSPGSIDESATGWGLMNQVSRFGVPCFFLVSGFLFMRSWAGTSHKNALLFRCARRLLLPFLFWALFYALVPPFISGEPHGIGAAIVTHLATICFYPQSFLMNGLVYHLWFLSSLLQGVALLWICLRFLDLGAAVMLGSVLYCLALSGSAYAPTLLGFHTHFAMRNGPFSSTLFVAIGACLAKCQFPYPLHKGIILLCFGFLLQLVEVTFLHARYGVAISNVEFAVGTVPYSVGIMMVMLTMPGFGESFGLALLGPFSLGIYAIHPYIIEVLRRGIDARSVVHWPLFSTVAVFVISATAALGLSKFQLTRRLVT